MHWRIDQVFADAIKKNSMLGEITHCRNVLDLCSIAVSAGTYLVTELCGQDDEGVLPFSITFLSIWRLDAEMFEIARQFASLALISS
jgi:hypothetical protein